MLPLDRGVIIDFNKFEVNSGFIYRQKDNNGYKIIATLTENNIPIPLANTTVSINIELAGTVTVATMTIESETQGIVSYILPECFVANSGTLVFDISVIRASDSIQLTSPKVKGLITVPVDKDKAIQCSDELPILLDLIEQVQAILDQSDDFLLKSVYDTNNDGKVNAADNSDNLNAQPGSHYLDRANHTGTQTASTISDFDAEVTNNPSVVANTAKVSFPEAPNDGKQYGRQSLGWTEVVHTGDMTKVVYDPTNKNADAFSMGNMVETATEKIFTDTERTKLTGIEAGAEVNVQSDWNQTVITEDDFIKNKPTDITDLSTHSVTELNDVTDAGSGQIITVAERTQIITNQTDIAALDTYVKDPQYTQDVFNVSSIESTGVGFNSDFTSPIDVSASFVESQLNDLSLKGNTYFNQIPNGDFSDGTTGYNTFAASISVANNVLSITADGTNEIGRAFDTTGRVNGTRYFCRAKLKVTNSVCDRLALQNAFQNTTDILNPSQDVVYDLFGVAVASSDGAAIIGFEHEYVDASTANGKVLEVQEAFAVNLDAQGETITDVNVLAQKYNFVDGLGNTLPQRIKSVGKNLFDSKFIDGERISETDGSIIVSSPSSRTEYIRIKDLTNYFQTIFTQEISNLRFAIYDSNRKFIQGTKGTSLIPNDVENAHYVIFSSVSINKTTNPQLEEGTFLTTFEEYKETTLHTPPDVVLRSVPNGVKDEISVTEGTNTQRVSDDYTLVADDIEVVLDGINATVVATRAFSDIQIGQANIKNGIVRLHNNLNEIESTNWDNVSNINNSYYTRDDQKIRFVLPLGTTLTDAKTALTGTVLNYQLAQSIITDANIQGNLISYENGTITYDPFIRNEFKYATGITIPSPDDGSNLKILEVEKAFEIVNDEYVEISSDRISISVDQETITITGATNGNFYTVYALLTSDESTVPENSYSLSVNSASQIQQNQVNTTQNSNRILTLEDKVSMLVAEIDDKLLP